MSKKNRSYKVTSTPREGTVLNSEEVKYFRTKEGAEHYKETIDEMYNGHVHELTKVNKKS